MELHRTFTFSEPTPVDADSPSTNDSVPLSNVNFEFCEPLERVVDEEDNVEELVKMVTMLNTCNGGQSSLSTRLDFSEAVESNEEYVETGESTSPVVDVNREESSSQLSNSETDFTILKQGEDDVNNINEILINSYEEKSVPEIDLHNEKSPANLGSNQDPSGSSQNEALSTDVDTNIENSMPQSQGPQNATEANPTNTSTSDEHDLDNEDVASVDNRITQILINVAVTTENPLPQSQEVQNVIEVDGATNTDPINNIVNSSSQEHGFYNKEVPDDAIRTQLLVQTGGAIATEGAASNEISLEQKQGSLNIIEAGRKFQETSPDMEINDLHTSSKMDNSDKEESCQRANNNIENTNVKVSNETDNSESIELDSHTQITHLEVGSNNTRIYANIDSHQHNRELLGSIEVETDGGKLAKVKCNFDEANVAMFYKEADCASCCNKDVAGDNEDLAGDTEDVAGDNEGVAGDNEGVAGDNKDVTGDNEDVASVDNSISKIIIVVDWAVTTENNLPQSQEVPNVIEVDGTSQERGFDNKEVPNDAIRTEPLMQTGGAIATEGATSNLKSLEQKQGSQNIIEAGSKFQETSPDMEISDLHTSSKMDNSDKEESCQRPNNNMENASLEVSNETDNSESINLDPHTRTTHLEVATKNTQIYLNIDGHQHNQEPLGSIEVETDGGKLAKVKCNVDETNAAMFYKEADCASCAHDCDNEEVAGDNNKMSQLIIQADEAISMVVNTNSMSQSQNAQDVMELDGIEAAIPDTVENQQTVENEVSQKGSDIQISTDGLRSTDGDTEVVKLEPDSDNNQLCQNLSDENMEIQNNETDKTKSSDLDPNTQITHLDIDTNIDIPQPQKQFDKQPLPLLIKHIHTITWPNQEEVCFPPAMQLFGQTFETVMVYGLVTSLNVENGGLVQRFVIDDGSGSINVLWKANNQMIDLIKNVHNLDGEVKACQESGLSLMSENWQPNSFKSKEMLESFNQLLHYTKRQLTKRTKLKLFGYAAVVGKPMRPPAKGIVSLYSNCVENDSGADRSLELYYKKNLIRLYEEKYTL